MKTKRGSILLPGLVILAAAVLAWRAPAARADQLVPQSRAPGQPAELPVGVGTGHAQPGFGAADAPPGGRPDADPATDLEAQLRQGLPEDGDNVEELAARARLLALTMVVVSYNIPTNPVKPVTKVDTGWKWQSSCWTLCQGPLLPPSKPDTPPVTSVPEPASVVSGLIGLCVTGAYVWRRRRRSVA
jgi:hypothetical protein